MDYMYANFVKKNGIQQKKAIQNTKNIVLIIQIKVFINLIRKQKKQKRNYQKKH